MHALEIENLTKIYFSRGQEFTAVSNLSFQIKNGTVFGFLGPNGAGKTTTMKMLVGLLTPNEGSIKIFGEPPESLEIRKRIGFMPETPAFYANLTAREFLHYISDIFELDPAIKKERTERLLKEVNLSEFGTRQTRKYSKGMTQRLALAQALINNPDLLLLDEPLDGLDPFGRAEVKQILLHLKNEGKTIIFSSHILADVAEICDEVGIIDHGMLVSHGDVSDVKGNFPTLEAAFVDIVNRFRETHPASTSHEI